MAVQVMKGLIQISWGGRGQLRTLDSGTGMALFSNNSLGRSTYGHVSKLSARFCSFLLCFSIVRKIPHLQGIKCHVTTVATAQSANAIAW